MYGCFSPVLIYGFMDTNEKKVLSQDFIDKHFNFIQIYAQETIRNYCTDEIYYGYVVSMREDGTIIDDDIDDKENIIKLYNMYMKQFPDSEATLGYHVALDGDYEMYEMETYVLTIV